VIWLVISLLLIGTALVFVILRQRQLSDRQADVVVPADLGRRVDAAVRALREAEAWQPAKAHEAPEAAAAIEAALIAGQPKKALEAAEAALGATPEGASARVWLAWALCANGQPQAALDQLAQARVLGATDGPLAGYVAARAEHLRFEHAAGATGPVPSIVTTADLAVVTLATGRGSGATWLSGSADVQLSAGEVRAAIAEHRETTARCLVRALNALELAPGFADAAYLVARLAIKAGFVPGGRTMFEALAPRMVGRPDVASFERDRKDLEDPQAAVSAARTKPVAPTAKRSRSLKVL
jgi:hypothetical protein